VIFGKGCGDASCSTSSLDHIKISGHKARGTAPSEPLRCVRSPHLSFWRRFGCWIEHAGAMNRRERDDQAAQVRLEAQLALRAQYCFLADLAGKAERFEDMLEFIKLVGTMPQPLSVAEYTMLQMAFKSVAGARRQAWRKTTAIIDVVQRGHSSERVLFIVGYAEHIRDEVMDTCSDVLDISRDQVTKCPGLDYDGKTFWHKLAGDCQRYMSEISSSREKRRHADGSLKSYVEARRIASEHLPPTHPTRLGLVLNLAILFHDVYDQQDKATTLLKVTFDETVAELDEVHRQGSEDFEVEEDTTLLLGLVKETLQKWTEQSNFFSLVDQTAPGAVDTSQGSGADERWNCTTYLD